MKRLAKHPLRPIVAMMGGRLRPMRSDNGTLVAGRAIPEATYLLSCGHQVTREQPSVAVPTDPFEAELVGEPKHRVGDSLRCSSCTKPLRAGEP